MNDNNLSQDNLCAARLEELRTPLIEKLEKYLPLKENLFKISYVAPKSLELIYDSQFCRINIIYSPGRYPGEEELNITYGRIHAPNEEPCMIWNGNVCYCWHDIRFLCLFFLEGYSPVHVPDKWSYVPYIEEYRNSEDGKTLIQDNTVEFVLTIEAMIWKRYASRLFELFDLERPNLFMKYSKFLEEFYRLQKWKPLPLFKGQSPVPPTWMIC